MLAKSHQIDYYFFSAGDEWYWQERHGTRSGDFHHEYLWGIRIGQTRLTPSLPLKLLFKKYDIYLKCINDRFALPVTYLVARLRRKPFILWTGIWMRLQSPAHKIFFPLTRYIYRHADAIVTYGTHVKRYLVSEGVDESKIFVTTHAVTNEDYNRDLSHSEEVELRQSLNLLPHHRVALFVGRMEEVKGLTFLLDAFKMIKDPDAVLVLAGSGSLRATIEQLAQEKGIIERVRFPGYLPIELAWRYHAIATVLALPSVSTRMGKETWGLVINEAFNQGVPVVATDAVGAAAGGLVQDGVNGFIVPEKDSPALAQAIQRILDDPALRTKMSTNAREIIASWDNEHMVEGFLDTIASVA